MPVQSEKDWTNMAFIKVWLETNECQHDFGLQKCIGTNLRFLEESFGLMRQMKNEMFCHLTVCQEGVRSSRLKENKQNTYNYW